MLLSFRSPAAHIAVDIPQPRPRRRPADTRGARRAQRRRQEHIPEAHLWRCAFYSLTVSSILMHRATGFLLLLAVKREPIRSYNCNSDTVFDSLFLWLTGMIRNLESSILRMLFDVLFVHAAGSN